MACVGLAAGTAATAEVTALAPAGAEEVSAQPRLAFAAEGVQTLGINALAQEEIARAGARVHRRSQAPTRRSTPPTRASWSDQVSTDDESLSHGDDSHTHPADLGALPPEINTSRLMAGAGAAPMLQAAAGWEALAISLETQADELAASLASLAAVWTGHGERTRHRSNDADGHLATGCCRCRR